MININKIFLGSDKPQVLPNQDVLGEPSLLGVSEACTAKYIDSESLQGIQSIVQTKVPSSVRVYLVRDCIVWVNGHWAARYTEQTL